MWSQVGLRSITTNKASGGDGIPVELFQILKDDAVKMQHSICQQIWKTQQWPQDWKRSVFTPIPKKGNAKESSTATAAKSLQLCPTLCDPIDSSPPDSCPRDSLGKNTGLCCHFLLQEIFSTQGLNPGLPQCRQMLYRLSHQGSPKRKRKKLWWYQHSN